MVVYQDKENKYFTPDLEDLRVGYEMEVNFHKGHKETYEPVTLKITENGAYGIIGDMFDNLDDGCYVARVPYLTRQKIEAEGWTSAGAMMIPGSDFIVSPGPKWCYTQDPLSKGDHWVWFSPKDYSFSITSVGAKQTYFIGTCKDINTFRYICKLLGI